MNEIDKINMAMNLVFDLLRHEEKILAIKLIRTIYHCGLHDAKSFVNFIECIYNLGN